MTHDCEIGLAEGCRPSDGFTTISNDEPMFALDGSWATDSRLCLKGTAPRPATICAAVIGMETRDS
jgi:hypothetical protein